MGNFSSFFSSADFFKNQFLKKILSGIPGIRVSNSLDSYRPNVMLDLIWVLTVCKCYQQVALVGNSIC